MKRTDWARQLSLVVAQRIRQVRLDQGVTQQALGKALDVSFQQIQKYETGANRIPVNRLLQIARALDVDVKCFFDGIATGTQSPSFVKKQEAAQRTGRRNWRTLRRRYSA